MKIETVRHICDRCKKELNKSENVREKRRLLIKYRSEYAIVFDKKWKEYMSSRDYYDLCDECRENLEVWLSGKNA